MDSLLNLQPSSTTFPDISTQTPNSTISFEASLQGNLLVPKAEPFDEFFTTPQQQQPQPHDGSDSEPDLYAEFNRISALFHDAFAQALQQPFIPDDVDTPRDRDLNPISRRKDADFSNQSINVDPNSQSRDENAVDLNLRAIVPVPPTGKNKSSSASTVRTVSRRKQSRVKELVRVTDVEPQDHVHFRDVMRKTRMIYDSLRVLATMEDEGGKKKIAAAVAAGEKIPEGNRGRVRGDLKAAALMRVHNLWLHREKRIVGAIPGIFVGDLFLFRMELLVYGLHGQIQAGIDYLPGSMSPNGEPIATSVIVSGGYEDDLDDGEVIIYTGHGGQEKNSSRQVSDQRLEGGNLALERSMRHGIEVRVIRGMRYEGSASSSGKVYVYDGLYRIVDCWFDVGKSGFGVYKYKLWRIEGQGKMGSATLKEARDVRKSGMNFKPTHCLSLDISDKKENVSVRLFNDIDENQEPLFYDYLPRTTFPPFVFHQSGKATGCDCVNGCADGCFCAMKNGGEFPYNQHGFLVRGKPLIFECGPFCSCPPQCRNRVTQKGLKNRLEVFRSRETGWGVRSLDVIHAGAFICEYAGVVLTREQAQILSMNGDALIYPNRFSERWAEWGDVSQIYSNYERPSYPSIPPLDFSLDVSTMRNVACYMSHSSTPNVFVQFVLYDHNNLMFPHLMLFAMENIPPMRELSLDYGIVDDYTGKLAICN